MDKINRYFLTGDLAVVGTGDVTMIAVPYSGHLTKIVATNEIIAAGADEVITASAVTAAGVATAITGGVITIADATAALGTTTLDIAQTDGSRVTGGGSIRLVNAGGSTNAGPGKFTVEITI